MAPGSVSLQRANPTCQDLPLGLGEPVTPRLHIMVMCFALECQLVLQAGQNVDACGRVGNVGSCSAAMEGVSETHRKVNHQIMSQSDCLSNRKTLPNVQDDALKTQITINPAQQKC